MTAIDLGRRCGPDREVGLRGVAAEHGVEDSTDTGQFVPAEQDEDD